MIDTSPAEPDRSANDQQITIEALDRVLEPTLASAASLNVVWLEAGAVILICSLLAVLVVMPSKA